MDDIASIEGNYYQLFPIYIYLLYIHTYIYTYLSEDILNEKIITILIK